MNSPNKPIDQKYNRNKYLPNRDALERHQPLAEAYFSTRSQESFSTRISRDAEMKFHKKLEQMNGYILIIPTKDGYHKEVVIEAPTNDLKAKIEHCFKFVEGVLCYDDARIIGYIRSGLSGVSNDNVDGFKKRINRRVVKSYLLLEDAIEAAKEEYHKLHEGYVLFKDAFEERIPGYGDIKLESDPNKVPIIVLDHFPYNFFHTFYESEFKDIQESTNHRPVSDYVMSLLPEIDGREKKHFDSDPRPEYELQGYDTPSSREYHRLGLTSTCIENEKNFMEKFPEPPQPKETREERERRFQIEKTRIRDWIDSLFHKEPSE